MALGLLLAFLNGMVMISSVYMASWVVAVLTCTIPLWCYAAAVLSRQRPLQLVELFGVVCGFAGIVVLMWPAADEPVRVNVPMALLLLLGAMIWGAVTVWEKGAPIPKRPLVSMGLQMTFAGVAFAMWSAVAGEWPAVHASSFTPQAWLSVAYLVLIASVLGYGAYMWLIVNAGATTANSFGYVSPAIAVLLGWVLLHEPLSVRTFVAFALIVLAVVLIVAPHPLRSGKPIEHRIHT
ncbi:MAG: EamA family transporter [Candidatus Eremiobacteraeota bacterium]|nr:EamA family transporter [Candidatus Eremiobacteraeota bacterium]